jgi:hypothetical protein
MKYFKAYHFPYFKWAQTRVLVRNYWPTIGNKIQGAEWLKISTLSMTGVIIYGRLIRHESLLKRPTSLTSMLKTLSPDIPSFRKSPNLQMFSSLTFISPWCNLRCARPCWNSPKELIVPGTRQPDTCRPFWRWSGKMQRQHIARYVRQLIAALLLQ